MSKMLQSQDRSNLKLRRSTLRCAAVRSRGPPGGQRSGSSAEKMWVGWEEVEMKLVGGLEHALSNI